MLSIQSCSSPSSPSNTGSTVKLTPNLLPCRISHCGAVNASRRFWDVRDSDDGSKTAHFRGRKLLGREVRVSKGYRGIAVWNSNRVLPSKVHTDKIEDDVQIPADVGSESEDREDGEDHLEEETPVKVLEQIASFDEIIVWGHERVAESDDVFVKGLEEWIKFAERMRGD